MRKRRISVWLACLVALNPGVGWGALGIGDIVFDPTNYIENLATAVNTAATLTEAIEISKNTLDNIASLEEVILMGSTYVRELDDLAREADAITRAMERVADQFTRLFGLDSLPLTAYEYSLRRTEIYGYKVEVADKAKQAQLLIRSTVNLVERIVRFLGSIGTLIGGKQATLTVLQAQLETLQTVQRSDVRQAALDHLQMVDMLDVGSSTESLRLIDEDAWKNW